MKILTFSPEAVNEEGNLIFEGTYQVKMPSFVERMKVVQSVQGKEEDNMAMAVRMAEVATDYISAVALVHKESGETFSSFEELSYCEEAALISAEAFKHVAQGRKLGKI